MSDEKKYDVIPHPDLERVSLFVRVKLENGTTTMAEIAPLTPEECDDLGGELIAQGRNVKRGNLISRAAGLI